MRIRIPILFMFALLLGFACAQGLMIPSLVRNKTDLDSMTRGERTMLRYAQSKHTEYQGYGRNTGGATRLIRAGELRQEKTDKGEMTYLENDVKIIQDSLTIWCKEARHYRNQHVLHLSGEVVMTDPEKTLLADKVTYYEDTKQSKASGNVAIVRDSLVLLSNEAHYFDQDKYAQFNDELYVEDLTRSVILTGDHGVYYTQKQKATVPSSPVLIRNDSTGAEEARIVAEYMEYGAKEGMATAVDSVVITWHEVRGTCDKLEFWPDSSRSKMIGNPRILRNRDEALGDTIWLYVTESALDSAVIVGRAISYTPSDTSEGSPRSTLRGDRIVMDFEDGRVIRMQSDGQAIGVYHLFEEGEDRGSNKVSGDRVVLLMGEEQLEDVIVVGGTEGTFLPPRLAKEVRQEGGNGNE